jgi:DNA-binding CsgD family transcriptional regulator
VSRRHARFFPSEDALLVEDLRSRNGVIVSGRRIQSATPLAHGDVARIGLEAFEVVDSHITNRPAELPTLAPPVRPSPEELPDDEDTSVTVAATLDVLTPREREVMELVVLGHTQREIADKLSLSVKTVESHRANLSHKLNCHSRADLVALALSAGMLKR